jgi:transcriptional regulator with XRE-family HTH domain
MTTKNKTSRDLFRDYGELTFGEVLRSFRLADELTQAQFARKLGISAANLCDLEKSRKLPSPARAAKMATKLGLPEPLLIQLALQGQLEQAHLDYKVSVAA